MKIKKIISVTLVCSIVAGMNFIGIKSANASVSQKYQSVEVTGFNSDLIANGNDTPRNSTNNDFDGNSCESVLYDQEYTTSGGATYHLSHGLPNNGVINSANLLGATYQLEDYSGNNALVLKGTETGTLTLKTPGVYEKLAILSASSNGGSTFSVTLNYSDGTSETKAFTVPDWCAVSSSYAITNIGRVSRKISTTTGDDALPGLYDNLINADSSKLVTSITFSKNADSGNDSKTGIFAICGIAPDGVPNAPVILDATEITTTSFEANWDSVSGATDYRLDVSTDSDFNDILGGYNNIQVSDTSYAVTGLDSDKTYYYRVRATNANGQSFSSNSSSLKTSKADTTTTTSTPSAVTVGSVNSLSDITVANGTSKSGIGLPSKANVVLSDGTTTSAAVTWNNGTPTYNGNVAGKYAFSGELTLPDGITNPSNCQAKETVIVNPAKTTTSSSGGGSSHHNTTTTNDATSTTTTTNTTPQPKTPEKIGWTQDTAGKWYYVADSGNKTTGWKLINNSWYFLDKKTGAMVTGWYKSENGDWSYDNADTAGQWFHLDADGKLTTGWYENTDGNWYYLCDGSQYGALGVMETGWKYINNNWYYFNSNGAMASNTDVNGYTLGSDGALSE